MNATGPARADPVSGESVPREPVALPAVPGRGRWIAAAIVLAAATVPFLGGLATPLLNDDRMAVVQNPVVQGDVDLARIFMTNSWGSVEAYRHTPNYRPLSVLTLAATRAVSGVSPLPFKATNLALHAAVSLGLLGLLLRLGVTSRAATLAAAAFGAHPVHAEALLFAVNREEILVALFLLAMIGMTVARSSGWMPAGTRRTWTPGALAGLGGLFAAGLLSKETGAAALVLVPLLLLARGASGRPGAVPGPGAAGSRWRACLRPTLVLAGVFAAYLVLRWAALGRLGASFIPFQDNPLVRADLAGRVSGVLVLVAHAAGLLVAPLDLSVDYSWNVLGLPPEGFPAAAWIGLAVVAAAIALFAATVRRRPVVALGILVLAIPYGIVSNAAYLSSIVFGERLLYVPSVGAAIALAGALDALPSGEVPGRRLGRLAAWTLLAAWVAFLGARAAIRVEDHRSAEALYASSLDMRPGSSRLHVNLGVALLETGRPAEAEAHLRQALAIDPEDPEAHLDLGLVLADSGRPAEAARMFLRAVDLRPGFREALAGLCLLLDSRRDDEAALDWCGRAAARGADVGRALRRLECEGRCAVQGATVDEEDPR